MINGIRAAYTPTIQELRSLILVADLGSTAAAAEALNLTQSAVSRSVGALEARLGVRLFKRERQRLTPTDAGRAMIRHARDILERLDTSSRMIMCFGGGNKVLRLGVLPTFAATWLIPRLPRFTKQHPDIALDINQALLPIDFEQSPFDAAIQRAELARPGTKILPLVQERLVVVAAVHLIGAHPIRPEDLLRFPLLQQATRPQLWSDWFQAAGIDPFGRIQGPRLEHFDMVLAAAQAGLGLALLPEIFAGIALTSGALVRLCPEISFDRSTYALIVPGVSKPESSVQVFADWLRLACTET